MKASADIQLPDTSKAIISDFTVRREVEVTYNCSQVSALNGEFGSIEEYGYISPNTIVGTCYVYIGSYRAKQKIDGKYYDGLIIKCNMEPNSFFDDKYNKFYGFSQYVNVMATLPYYCVYQGNSPTNNTSNSSGYSITLTGVGSGASVAGNVSLQSDFCEVADYSSNGRRCFDIVYDYKTDFFAKIFDGNPASKRSNALFKSTWQAATCEWTSTIRSYSVMVKVNARFGISTAPASGGIIEDSAKGKFDCSVTKRFGARYSAYVD